MTTQEARQTFNAAIKATADPDAVAKLEIVREYFTNAEFRAKLEDFTFERTYRRPDLAAA